MSISFTCPHCGLHTQVAELYGGQIGSCAGCGRPITVPVLTKVNRPVVAPPPDRGKAVALTLALVAAIILGSLVVTAMVVAFYVPSLQSTRTVARRVHCASNLRRIGLAVQRYHEVHGSFPPAYVPDEKGTPMHSWRVLLLPFLDEQELYAQFDFSKAWNSPENMALARRMPAVYACPDDVDAQYGETSYLAIVGHNSVFDGENRNRLQDVADGAEQTIIIVESAGGGVPWLAPTDFDIRRSDSKGGIRSRHSAAGAHVLMADGSVYPLADYVPLEVVEAMISISGGEFVSPKYYASN